MRLSAQTLNEALQKKLAPVYFLSGDEPLQLGEAADAVRKTARQAGFTEREVITVDAHFGWHTLAEAAGALSIFADKKIIDLRIPDGKLGNDGSKALQAYCEHPPSDTLLLISTAKIATTSLKSRWFEALDKCGVVVQIWPLDGKELVQWLQQRAARRGLSIEIDGIKLLASKIEGNLLAAAQEIEKLFVLQGDQLITAQVVAEVVADSARYDVFKLIDAVLVGRVNRLLKILHGLQDEGIAAPIVLWGLTRETRLLLSIQSQLKQGLPKEQVFRNHQLWDKRKSLINDALARLNRKQLFEVLVLSATADQQIKGQQRGDPWETLLHICLLFTAPLV
ncbi:MAG: DNA polymerase III subunit delta [Methylococcaceae bacterium]|nr:DNA polymerase III subunit delta [Methylococcaceae bacterium]